MERLDTRKLRRWYDIQAPLYHWWRDNYDNDLAAEARRFLQQHAPTQRVLDIGCGTGLFTIALAGACPDWRLDGIDFSRGMLDVAQRQSRRQGLENVTFVHGDVLALPVATATYDGVVAAGVFPNLNDWPGALGEVARVLKDDGVLVIIEFDRSRMTRLSRLFFRTMIAGYKTFTACFRRYRFASRWNLETGTVDRGILERNLRDLNLLTEKVLQISSHLVYRVRKSPGR